MTANWKDASKELPPERVRVLVCDLCGYLQTAFMDGVLQLIHCPIAKNVGGQMKFPMKNLK